MNSILYHLLIYFISFAATWYGTGLIVASVVNLSQRLKISAFSLSFFVLGLLTSLPELVIGLSSIANGKPEIFVGNLIGGILLIFLLIIPLLGLFGNGLSSPKNFDKKFIFLVLVICFIPSLLAGDKQIDSWEGILSIILYLLLLVFFFQDQSLFERLSSSFSFKKTKTGLETLKILLGIAMVVFAGDQIVKSTIYFADLLSIAPFFVSLIIVSFGTNVPEISLVFRTIYQKKKDVAFADYLGSATVNTLLLGLLTLLNQAPVVIPNQFFHRIFFTVAGLVAFFWFLRSKNKLSRIESAVLLGVYVLFIVAELLIAQG